MSSWHLLLVDLDGFKQINDTFGHHAGDHLLQVAAERMRHIAAGAGLAARLGGDEFAIALPRGLSDTRQMARTLIEAISRPVHYEGKELRIAASIGIASSVNIDQSTEEFGICKRADLALYAAKRAGKRQYRVFDATLAVSLPNAGRRKTDINPAETALGEVAERLGLAGPKNQEPNKQGYAAR